MMCINEIKLTAKNWPSLLAPLPISKQVQVNTLWISLLDCLVQTERILFQQLLTNCQHMTISLLQVTPTLHKILRSFLFRMRFNYMEFQNPSFLIEITFAVLTTKDEFILQYQRDRQIQMVNRCLEQYPCCFRIIDQRNGKDIWHGSNNGRTPLINDPLI